MISMLSDEGASGDGTSRLSKWHLGPSSSRWELPEAHGPCAACRPADAKSVVSHLCPSHRERQVDFPRTPPEAILHSCALLSHRLQPAAASSFDPTAHLLLRRALPAPPLSVPGSPVPALLGRIRRTFCLLLPARRVPPLLPPPTALAREAPQQ